LTVDEFVAIARTMDADVRAHGTIPSPPRSP
jgi:hypothetical protein